MNFAAQSVTRFLRPGRQGAVLEAVLFVVRLHHVLPPPPAASRAHLKHADSTGGQGNGAHVERPATPSWQRGSDDLRGETCMSTITVKMDAYEAVTSRRAVRGFTDEPVSRVV